MFQYDDKVEQPLVEKMTVSPPLAPLPDLYFSNRNARVGRLFPPGYPCLQCTSTLTCPKSSGVGTLATAPLLELYLNSYFHVALRLVLFHVVRETYTKP